MTMEMLSAFGFVIFDPQGRTELHEKMKDERSLFERDYLVISITAHRPQLWHFDRRPLTTVVGPFLRLLRGNQPVASSIRSFVEWSAARGRCSSRDRNEAPLQCGTAAAG
jgi:hypothetical protein